VNNASFNGTNLVDGTTLNIQALASTDGAKRITVSGQTLKLSGLIVTLTTTGTISTLTKASSMITTINTSIANVNASLAKMASGSKKFTIQNDFVSKLVDALNSGIGSLVDADMAIESAKLQSLQVKQQLGVQALSIANSAPAITLSLFR
jgi:flagellin